MMQKSVFTNYSQEELKELLTGCIEAVLDKNQAEPKQDQQNDLEQGEKLLSIKQVCELLQVSKVTIHKWKREGLLPFHRMGRRVYFKYSEVMDVLKSINPKK